MTSPFSAAAHHDPGPGMGAWRPLLRKRFAGRAEPLFVDAGGLRSAASIWSGAQTWAELLRSRDAVHNVVVRQADRLALLQLLVAVLWDGRPLLVEAHADAQAPDGWCLDGRQVLWEGQPVCALHDGGWPTLAGPARLSALAMLGFAPAQGSIAVQGRQASHAELWAAHGAPLGHPPPAQPAAGSAGQAPSSAVLEPFDLAALATPLAVLDDALLPLLRCTEVWERAALPPA